MNFSDSLMIPGPDWGSTGEKMMKVACQLPFQTRLLIEKFPGLRLKGKNNHFLSFLSSRKIRRADTLTWESLAGPVSLYTEG